MEQQLHRVALSPARTSSQQLEAALRATLSEARGQPKLLADMAGEHLDAGGKRLRARLALVAAEHWQVPTDRALAWAVACELLHNGTLVHDDLQDGDTLRRGAPTVWARHGAAQAINLGDWLLMRAFAAVDVAPTLPAEAAWPLSQALRTALEAVIAGQTAECAWRGQQIVPWQSYSTCIRGKTAALFALPIAGAARLAGHSAVDVAAASQAFSVAGELFQLVDDVVDLYGDKGRVAPGQDLYEGKMSALVVAHARLVPGDARWLAQLLATPREQTPANEVAKASAAFVANGALAEVQRRIAQLHDEARRCCPADLGWLLDDLLSLIEQPLATLTLPSEQGPSGGAGWPQA